MVLNCSHHYCKDCGWHHGTGHEEGCRTGAYEKRMEEYRKRARTTTGEAK